MSEDNRFYKPSIDVWKFNKDNYDSSNIYIKMYKDKYVFNYKGVPKCSCGGIIKPKVVLYEEALPEFEFIESEKAIKNADMLIVAGTSLTVYPASGLVNLFRGKYLVILNKEDTLYDSKADLVIHDKLSNIIKNIDK